LGESEGELSIAYSNREEEEEAMAPPATEARRSKRRNLNQRGKGKSRRGFGGLARLRCVLRFWSVRALLVLEFVGS